MAEAINLYHLCQSFHCLPRAGGLLDQDHIWVRLMEAVESAYQERRARLLEKQNRQGK